MGRGEAALHREVSCTSLPSLGWFLQERYLGERLPFGGVFTRGVLCGKSQFKGTYPPGTLHSGTFRVADFTPVLGKKLLTGRKKRLFI
jgi:hypothetical protein